MRKLAYRAGLIIGGILLVVASAGLTYGLMEESKIWRHPGKCTELTCKEFSKESKDRPKDLGKHLDVIVKAQKKILKIPIITYHYVEYVKDPNDKIRISLNINPFILEQELKTLKANDYTTYFVKDIPALVDGRMPYATKSAVLTFDDGYEDAYTNVFPLLKKYNMKATFYIISNFMNRSGFMTDFQLKTMLHSPLVEIGAHTANHAYLKSLKADIVRKEVIGGKKQLEDILGAKVETFAYPYGVFNTETVGIVKDASFSAAVSEIPGSIQSDENMLYLSRFRAGKFTASNIVKVLENLPN